jgi:hypothetical protein
MSNLAIIADSTDFSQLYTTLAPAGPNIARLRINRDSSVEGSDGSLLTVPAPSLALRDTDDTETVFERLLSSGVPRHHADLCVRLGCRRIYQHVFSFPGL